uniref:Uncharacterized protein n=1 Tax=Oryza brachyantha TaxID=4533 RepID=J3N4P9_ORYBR
MIRFVAVNFDRFGLDFGFCFSVRWMDGWVDWRRRCRRCCSSWRARRGIGVGAVSPSSPSTGSSPRPVGGVRADLRIRGGAPQATSRPAAGWLHLDGEASPRADGAGGDGVCVAPAIPGKKVG